MDHQLPPYPPYQGPPVPPPAHPAWNGKTNGFSIASLALALFGCAGLPSIIFGIIGLRQSKRNGDRRGRFYAIAGLTICGLWLAAIAVAVIVNIAKGPDRDATGAVKGERSIALTSLRAGDCLKDLSSQTGNYADVVPCADQHTTEVFAVVTLPKGDWPGDAQIKRVAEDGCDERYAGYAGAKLDPSKYTVLAAPPEKLDWPGDREVLCLAHHLGGPTTGSLRG